MKLVVPSLLLLAGVEGVKVGGNTKTTLKDLVPNMAEFRRVYVPNNRMLEVSAQCEADSQALYNNSPELVNAFSAWEAELNEKAVCDPDPSSTAVECSFDSATLQSHQTLVQACTDAGGKVYLTSLELSCQIIVEGQSASFAIDFDNIPDCLATSCDEANVNELVGDFGEELDQAYEETLGLFVDSVQCDASTMSGTGSTNGGGGTTTGTGTAPNSSAYSITGAISAIMMALMPLAV